MRHSTDALGSDLCANVTWVPSKSAIEVVTSYGALHLLSYEFTKNNTHYCAGKDQVKACVGIGNFTVTKQGCCGCVDINLALGPINLSEKTGCFAFGTPHCPLVECERFSGDCQACGRS